MRGFLRDLLSFSLFYVAGCIASFAWVVYGLWVYTRPVQIEMLEPEFNRDIGTSLVSQGVIFLVTFVVAAVIRAWRGDAENKQQAEDRKLLREVHQWLKEARENSHQ